MTWLIIVGVALYVTIGLFLNGFFEIEINDDLMPFMGVMIFWPLIIAIAALLIITRIPYRLGKKLGDKYSSAVQKMLNKLFD